MVLFAAKSMFFSDLFNWTLDVERWTLSVFSLHHKPLLTRRNPASAGRRRLRCISSTAVEAGVSPANGVNGMSDIEGKVAREAMSECGQGASFKRLNGADGISDIEGEATRVGASERGQWTSFNPRCCAPSSTLNAQPELPVTP